MNNILGSFITDLGCWRVTFLRLVCWSSGLLVFAHMLHEVHRSLCSGAEITSFLVISGAWGAEIGVCHWCSGLNRWDNARAVVWAWQEITSCLVIPGAPGAPGAPNSPALLWFQVSQLRQIGTSAENRDADRRQRTLMKGSLARFSDFYWCQCGRVWGVKSTNVYNTQCGPQEGHCSWCMYVCMPWGAQSLQSVILFLGVN